MIMMTAMTMNEDDDDALAILYVHYGWPLRPSSLVIGLWELQAWVVLFYLL